MTLQEKLNELDRLSEKADEIICDIHSSGGEKGIFMSIPPNKNDSDMILTEITRIAVPQLVKALRECLTTLELISKNKTDDCEIYTMGCDCDEECLKAIKKVNEIMGIER